MTTDFREHVTLGRTGLRVSRLGIGAGYGISAAACEKAFHEHRVNYFYWSLTRRAGMRKAIRNLAPKHRDDLVIVVQTYDHFGPMMESMFDRQLRSLKIDHADILLLGWFNRFPPPGVLNSARRILEKGKAKYLAMSGHVRSKFAEIAQMPNNRIDIFMIRYNAVHGGAERDIFPYLPAQNRPGITTYTTTCWGKLLDSSKLPDGARPLRGSDCYRFALSNPNVDLCMMGPKDQKEMDEALKTLELGPLANDEMEQIRRVGDYIYGKPRVSAA